MKKLRHSLQLIKKRLVSVASIYAFAMALFPGTFCYFVAVHRGDDLPSITSYFLIIAAWPWWLARAVGAFSSNHPSYLTVAFVVFVGWYLALLRPSERALKQIQNG